MMYKKTKLKKEMNKIGNGKTLSYQLRYILDEHENMLIETNRKKEAVKKKTLTQPQLKMTKK